MKRMKLPDAFGEGDGSIVFVLDLPALEPLSFGRTLTAFPKERLFLCRSKIRPLYQRENNLVFLSCCFSKRLSDRWNYLEKVSDYSECCNFEDRGFSIFVNCNDDI